MHTETTDEVMILTQICMVMAQVTRHTIKVTKIIVMNGPVGVSDGSLNTQSPFSALRVGCDRIVT
jgi:3-phosphoglycerate kinase